MRKELRKLNDKPIVINIPKVEEWTLTQLRYTCKKNKVKGYTKMDRSQLVKSVKHIIENLRTKEN